MDEQQPQQNENVGNPEEAVEARGGEAPLTTPDYLAELKLVQAEFANYRKDESRRMSDFAKYAHEETVRRFLPIHGMLSRAVSEHPAGAQPDAWVIGVANIAKAFGEALAQLGVREIKTLGESYDPKYHEAVETVEGKGEPDKVIEEVEKGYMWEDGRVIQAAKVKVSK